MHAYKFLGSGARARFSGLSWPLPADQGAGAWVEATGPLEPCVRGVHACRGEDLPYWIDSELWRVELGGELHTGGTMLIAERGRLLARVEAWDDSLKAEFASFCRERARSALARARPQEQAHAQRYLKDVEALAALGELATAAYISAVSAACGSELPESDAYVAERSAQACWLLERLP